MKVITFKGEEIRESILHPETLLGEAVTIQMKDGAAFRYKVLGHRAETQTFKEMLIGYDDEHRNTHLAVEDIDFVIRRSK